MLGPKSIKSSPATKLSTKIGATTRKVGSSLNVSTDASNSKMSISGKASQCSLLVADKSSSRGSLVSETSNSVCSSSLLGATSSPRGSQVSLRSGLPLAMTTRLPVQATKSKTTASSSLLRKPLAQRTGVSGPNVSSCKSGATAPSISSGSVASSVSSCKKRAVPTLAMSLRDKDQQIKLLIRERDEQKFQAELMAQRVEDWKEKFVQSELERSHVTSEADDEVVELRRLAQELEDENKRLSQQLGQREQVASDQQFKLDELECERVELKRQLEIAEQEMNSEELAAINGNQQMDDRPTGENEKSRVKLEREIGELKEKLLRREEQMMQLRSSLEMRKGEVVNLQTRALDLERRLKIETERSERHLKRIDEINLELKGAEARLSTRAEENEMYDKQVRQLRQELRATEEKLEQVSLARKKDVEVLNGKLTAARRTTPTSPQPYKTPTPQDEIVRLQVEIRDLKDLIIDREAELDCSRRDMEVIRRKMETRTLEVDCNNQELARRCQDLLEQNRQSEETVKQLLKSTTEHSAQLMRATHDLKEANGKCLKLTDEIQELEAKLEEQIERSSNSMKENGQLKIDNEELREQVELLRQQIDSMNQQLSDLCQQLDTQTNSLHKDRECLAEQLTKNELESAQIKHDLATARQDLRTSKLQTQEMLSERDRLKADLEIKEKYIGSRNDIIETMKRELETSKKLLAEHKQRIEQLRLEGHNTLEANTSANVVAKELKNQLETLKIECKSVGEQNVDLRNRCQQLQSELQITRSEIEEADLAKFDEMRLKHSAEVDQLKLAIKNLEERLTNAINKEMDIQTNTNDDDDDDDDDSDNDGRPSSDKRREILTGSRSQEATSLTHSPSSSTLYQDDAAAAASIDNATSNSPDNQKSGSEPKKDDYETQIEFLNSVVVDMQRKCDEYKNRLDQMETINMMNEFDNLINSNEHQRSRSNIMIRKGSSATLGRNAGINSEAIRDDITNKKSVNLLDRKEPTRISGRPYCNTCKAYDLHHTIHCPKSASDLLGILKASNESENSVSAITVAKSVTINEDNNISHGSNNYNNNNNDRDTISYMNGNKVDDKALVEELFREYEASLFDISKTQYSSLRRTTLDKAPRPYCDNCDLFGHTLKSCGSLRV